MKTTIVSRPMPVDELNRQISLSDLDVDYSNLKESYSDLTKLAAKVAGAPISLINLIDSFTQWTVCEHGVPGIEQMPREESVCQYTIVEKEYLEIKNLSEDERFKDAKFVKGEPNIRYYFGIPIQSDDGHNIGALCVLDKVEREISPEKVDLLKMIAREIVNRLKVSSLVDKLKTQVTDANSTKLKIAHDIRGPLSGITSLAQYISEQGDKNKLDDVLQLITMIYKSGNSLLELAEEILSDEKKADKADKAHDFTLTTFQEKLLKLYHPQAHNKQINFEVLLRAESAKTPIIKNKLLQISGNLISNAIKFTPVGGNVTVKLDAVTDQNGKVILDMIVSDSGIGLDEETAQSILHGNASSTNGTSEENGYGFGLALVKHLVNGLKGTMEIYSKEGEGATFYIRLPQ
jgi:signal transduction histidine kinase